MDFSKHVFRSHMVGKIINVPKPLTVNQSETLKGMKDKGYNDLTTTQKKTYVNLCNKYNESKKIRLTEANKTILAQLVYAHKYGRTIDINSSKLTKGIDVEKHSRDLLGRVTNLFLTASSERKTNDWVTGAIDVEPNDVIIDIKSSWSWESFSKILTDKPNEVYLRQGDCYMDLWSKKEFLLCHILVDTPYQLVERELKNEDYKNNILNVEGEVREEKIEEVKQIVTNHIFSIKALKEFCELSPIVYLEWFKDFKEIPEHERVHMIPHSLDKERIEQRNESISLARKYMKTVKPVNNFNPNLIK